MEHCSPLLHSTSKTRGGESVATAAGTCPLAGGKSLGQTWQRWQHSANLLYRWLAPCSPLFSGHDPSVAHKGPGHEAIHPSQPSGAPQTPQPPWQRREHPKKQHNPQGIHWALQRAGHSGKAPGRRGSGPRLAQRGQGRAGRGVQAAGCHPGPRAGAEASGGRPGGRHLSGGGAAAMLGGGRGQRGPR